MPLNSARTTGRGTGIDGRSCWSVIPTTGGPASRSFLQRSVITAAGTADPFGPVISDFAPDEGENLTDPQAKFPSPEIIAYIVEHQLPEGGNGFTLAAEGFHESFGADLLADDAAF